MSGLVRTEIAGAAFAAPEEKGARFRSAFFHVARSMFLGALDQTIIATALPAIAGSFGGLSYYRISTSCNGGCPLYGRIGDAFGRKRMLLWALSLFVAGSAACAIAPNLAILVCARALQGFGGGGLKTLAQVAVSTTTARTIRLADLLIPFLLSSYY